MFRFFRMLRMQLFTGNRISKYLLYAVGEIILVVIGILLALQINTWNLERLARQDENVYLSRIVSDLQTDLVSLERVRASHEQRVIIGTEILEQMGDNNLPTLRARLGYQKVMERAPIYSGQIPESFGGKLFDVLTISRFYQTDHTFQEMLDTGKIDLIRDQDLKLMIVNQYQTTRSARSFQDEIVMHVQHGYREAMVENGISTMNRASYNDLLPELPDKTGLQVELENYLQICIGQLEDMFYIENSLADTTHALIERIEAYLKG